MYILSRTENAFVNPTVAKDAAVYTGQLADGTKPEMELIFKIIPPEPPSNLLMYFNPSREPRIVPFYFFYIM